MLLSTSTAITQVPPAGMVPLVSRTSVAPAVAVTTAPGPQLLALAFGVWAMVTPAGRLSCSTAPVSATAFAALLMLMLRRSLCPTRTLALANDFVIGAALRTFSVALAGAVFCVCAPLPSVPMAPPAGIVLT